MLQLYSRLGVFLPRRVLAAAVLSIGAACAEPTAVGEEPPDFRGTVSVVPPGSPTRSVLVAELGTPASGYTSIELVIVPAAGPSPTIHILESSGRLTRATVAELREGVQISAWVRPGERRSDPPQWEAERVIIHDPTRR